MAEALSGRDFNDVRHYSFLDHLVGAKVEAAASGSASGGTLAYNGTSTRTLFLNPPARITFGVPVGAAGGLHVAISLHPDVWDNAESGACQFVAEVDGRTLLDEVLDPLHEPNDRQWLRFDLAVPESFTGGHTFVFRTVGAGSEAFRWALWRAPIFTWSAAHAASNGDSTASDQRLSLPEFVQPGRTIR